MDFNPPALKRLSDVTRSELTEIRSLEFMKFLGCYSSSRGVKRAACEWYLSEYGADSYGSRLVQKELDLIQPGIEQLQERAAAPPATTLDSSYAAPLVGIEMLASGFLRQVFSASLLGRIPNLRQIPFQVKVPEETAGANYQWIGEGSGKPVSSMSFSTATTLTRLKAVAIVVFSEELVKAMTDATAVTLRNTLRDGLVNFTDKAFLSTDAAIANVRPAGILAGVTAITPGANLGASMTALINAFFTARPGAQDPVLIAGPQKAAEIRTLNSGGGVGLPIVVTAAAGSKVILFDGNGAVFGDDGLTIDVSGQAAFEMNDAPTSPPTASVVFRSMWQDNLRAFRVERFVNWWRQTTSVQFLA